MNDMFWGAKKFDKNTIKGWELKGKSTDCMIGEYQDMKLGWGTKKIEDFLK